MIWSRRPAAMMPVSDWLGETYGLVEFPSVVTALAPVPSPLDSQMLLTLTKTSVPPPLARLAGAPTAPEEPAPPTPRRVAGRAATATAAIGRSTRNGTPGSVWQRRLRSLRAMGARRDLSGSDSVEARETAPYPGGRGPFGVSRRESQPARPICCSAHRLPSGSWK